MVGVYVNTMKSIFNNLFPITRLQVNKDKLLIDSFSLLSCLSVSYTVSLVKTHKSSLYYFIPQSLEVRPQIVKGND